MHSNLLLVGSGHAHLTILKNLNIFLESGYEVTVVNTDDYHYYSGMGPGMLSGIYSPQDIRFHVERMVSEQGGHFIRDECVAIDPDSQFVKTRSGRKISYDAVSFNIGSSVPLSGVQTGLNTHTHVFPVKPIKNLLSAKNHITSLPEQKKISVLVAGGGPSGVEIAANVFALAKKYKKTVDITIVAGKTLLYGFEKSFRVKAGSILAGYGVNLLENCKAHKISDHKMILSSGDQIFGDIVFWAVGIMPPPLFRNAGLPAGTDGGLLVNEFLQSVAYPNIFGGGDCIRFQQRKLDKAGVYAVRQSPVLFRNLKSFLEQKPLQTFVPQKDYLIILNMGNKKGLLKWKNIVFDGKPAFWLKDYIDRGFVKKYQTSHNRG